MIMTNKKYLHEDISDSPEDQEKLKGENATLNLPEIKDIPGAARSGKNSGSMPGDTTFSSADEEGDELFRDEDTEGSNVSSLDKQLLRNSFNPSYDSDLPVDSLSLDSGDNEGELLEEGSQAKDLFGKDLDDDLIEEEDEETDGEAQQ
jgi:hypothetical protein